MYPCVPPSPDYFGVLDARGASASSGFFFLASVCLVSHWLKGLKWGAGKEGVCCSRATTLGGRCKGKRRTCFQGSLSTPSLMLRSCHCFRRLVGPVGHLSERDITSHLARCTRAAYDTKLRSAGKRRRLTHTVFLEPRRPEVGKRTRGLPNAVVVWRRKRGAASRLHLCTKKSRNV
jgi:hypothetical protein